MKMTLSTNQAETELRRAGFTYDGAQALVEYYEELEEQMGDSIELDPIAVRCDWAEYDRYLDIENDYDSLDDVYVIKHRSGWLVQNY